MYMDKLIDMIKTQRNLSETTLKGYFKSLLRLQKIVNLKNVEQFINNNDKVLDRIKVSYKKPYQLNLINCMIVAIEAWNINNPSPNLDNDLIIYRKYQMLIKDELDETKYDQKKNLKEDENWESWQVLVNMAALNFKIAKKILKRYDELTIKDGMIVMKYLISQLYTTGKENPPLRLDYNNMIVITKEEYEKEHSKTQNYLVVQSSRTKYFVLHEYKTFKKYGIKSIKLAPVLNRAVNLWLKVKTRIKGIDNNYLLFNNQNSYINESSMSNLISDAFNHTGKKINANLIRHIFITDIANKLNLAERKVVAEKMCHNVLQSLMYEKNS